VCGSSGSDKTVEEERKKDRALDQKLRADMLTESRVYKLLLLGPGESGKSTFFKQLAFGYGTGFNEQERLGFVSTIRSNVVFYMAELASRARELAKEHGITMLPENDADADQIIRLSSEGIGLELDSVLAGKLRKLWNDPCVKKAWEMKSRVQVPESTEYFIEKRLDDMLKTDYMPTDDDLLLLRTRTTGILEQRFTIENNEFLIVDVGGQRSERRKWINCFDSVTAVLFVASIGSYDQTVWEDETTNRVIEALNLFEETVNQRAFCDTSFVLFLNKEDIFREKLARGIPLKGCFDEYTGPNEYEAAASFIMKKFAATVKNPEKQVFMHLTNATDADKVMFVFNAVRDSVIKALLQDNGLL